MRGQCKLCGEEAELVRSHIIPRSLFEIDRDAPPKLLSNTPGEFPKRSPIGIYDYIVCESCERRFSPFDDYASDLIRHWPERSLRITDGERIAGYEIAEFNYRLLKLFAIATLWRASASTHSFYNRVQLGPFEPSAREMLLRGDPGEPDIFATWWSVFDAHTAPLLMDPFHEHWEGVAAYRFYLGRAVAYIKVDRRPAPSIFGPHLIQPGAPLRLINRKLEGSHDLEAVRAVAQAHPRIAVRL